MIIFGIIYLPMSGVCGKKKKKNENPGNKDTEVDNFNK